VLLVPDTTVMPWMNEVIAAFPNFSTKLSHICQLHLHPEEHSSLSDRLRLVVAHFVTNHLALGSNFRLNCQLDSLLCRFFVNFALCEVCTVAYGGTKNLPLVERHPY
jgi:hypothetical protein